MSPGDFSDLMMAGSIISTDPEAIARLQASIDAISIEVERISEGQRFTTRLLNERIGEPSKIGSGQ